MADKYSEDELAKRTKSSGWGLMTGKSEPHVTGTLEDVAKAAHAPAIEQGGSQQCRRDV